jgi:hypothetical protein
MAVCDLLVRLFKPTLVEAGSDVIHVFTFRSFQDVGAMEFDGNVLRSGVAYSSALTDIEMHRRMGIEPGDMCVMVCYADGSSPTESKVYKRAEFERVVAVRNANGVEVRNHAVTSGHGPGSCGMCGKRECDDGTPLKTCGKCRAVWYCSRDCQKAHHGVHKRECL